jgi:DNA-binding CsgD family transcriptional regulator
VGSLGMQAGFNSEIWGIASRTKSVHKSPLGMSGISRHGGSQDMIESFWTPQRDKRLQRLQAAGLSAAQIAERIGATRNAVIGRSIRLRGIVFPSQIRKAKAQAAERTARRRDKKRRTQAGLAAMRQAIARRVPRDRAIVKAVEAGLTYQAIGNALGLSRQRVHQIISSG